ncbi:hypothetical protein cyc_02630 [Cyclospora cayetanensis]|uniref:Uncharacterized protein n=1 Tax=Cyclospora cayetanensis TaxID=88456 RepID=A0A1D3CRM5_9EIME|nr:hypothetical protein cyc_02630 [Cyclospora cayetanensis]
MALSLVLSLPCVLALLYPQGVHAELSEKAFGPLSQSSLTAQKDFPSTEASPPASFGKEHPLESTQAVPRHLGVQAPALRAQHIYRLPLSSAITYYSDQTQADSAAYPPAVFLGNDLEDIMQALHAAVEATYITSEQANRASLRPHPRRLADADPPLRDLQKPLSSLRDRAKLRMALRRGSADSRRSHQSGMGSVSGGVSAASIVETDNAERPSSGVARLISVGSEMQQLLAGLVSAPSCLIQGVKVSGLPSAMDRRSTATEKAAGFLSTVSNCPIPPSTDAAASVGGNAPESPAADILTSSQDLAEAALGVLVSPSAAAETQLLLYEAARQSQPPTKLEEAFARGRQGAVGQAFEAPPSPSGRQPFSQDDSDESSSKASAAPSPSPPQLSRLYASPSFPPNFSPMPREVSPQYPLSSSQLSTEGTASAFHQTSSPQTAQDPLSLELLPSASGALPQQTQTPARLSGGPSSNPEGTAAAVNATAHGMWLPSSPLEATLSALNLFPLLPGSLPEVSPLLPSASTPPNVPAGILEADSSRPWKPGKRSTETAQTDASASTEVTGAAATLMLTAESPASLLDPRAVVAEALRRETIEDNQQPIGHLQKLYVHRGGRPPQQPYQQEAQISMGEAAAFNSPQELLFSDQSLAFGQHPQQSSLIDSILPENTFATSILDETQQQAASSPFPSSQLYASMDLSGKNPSATSATSPIGYFTHNPNTPALPAAILPSRLAGVASTESSQHYAPSESQVMQYSKYYPIQEQFPPGDNVVGTAAAMLMAAHSLLKTGETVMSAVPLQEMLLVGQQLQQSGFFRSRGVQYFGLRAPLFVGNKRNLPPPPGAGRPSVICASEGMTCCVPETAVSHWREQLPYLNNHSNDRPCKAHFVSVKNALCASTSYPRAKGGASGEQRINFRDSQLCGMGIVETNSFWVYRHLLVIPDNTMNDAVCECKEPKTANEEGRLQIEGFANWEYSLTEVKKAAEEHRKGEELAQRIGEAIAMTSALRGPDGVLNKMAEQLANGALATA